jgi:hypothetical protein
LSLVVKPPVVSKCQSAGLRGCDDLADGVIDYLEGEKETAKGKVVSAASKNDPKKMREFAVALKALADLPGLGDKGDSIRELADLLSPGANEPLKQKEPNEKSSETQTRPAAAPKAQGPERAFTADSDPARLLFGTVRPTTGAHERCDGESTLEAFCKAAQRGPFIVTDVVATGPCGGEASVGAKSADTGAIEWFVDTASPLHGSRLLVTANDVLVVGAVPAKGHVHVEDRCSVAWFGFKPYEPAKATDDADDDGDGEPDEKHSRTGGDKAKPHAKDEKDHESGQDKNAHDKKKQSKPDEKKDEKKKRK